MTRTTGSFVLMVCGLMAAVAPTVGLAEDGDGVESAANPSSPEEMLGDAKSTISFIQDAVGRAAKVHDQASRDEDDKLLDCIASPYSSLKTLQRVATGRLDEMQSLLAQELEAQAGRVARTLVVLRDKTSTFVAQAEACTADGKAQEGNSTVNSNAEAVSNDDDTSPLLGDDLVDIDPPPISPFD